MPKILVIHGAGMGMRGKAQIEVFGPMTLPEYDKAITAFATEVGVDVDIFYSNSEGKVIDRLLEAHDQNFDGAIINPDGFTKGYPAWLQQSGASGFQQSRYTYQTRRAAVQCPRLQLRARAL